MHNFIIYKLSFKFKQILCKQFVSATYWRRFVQFSLTWLVINLFLFSFYKYFLPSQIQ